MRDFRYNDISRRLRNTANRLENEAKEHRILADKLDFVTSGKPPEPLKSDPAYIKRMDALARPLIALPAAKMRKAVSAVAHENGEQVLPLAIHARNIRADQKSEQRRKITVDLFKCLGRGLSQKDAAKLLGISVSTADRLRDGWIKSGKA
jgi:hypothetical protein